MSRTSNITCVPWGPTRILGVILAWAVLAVSLPAADAAPQTTRRAASNSSSRSTSRPAPKNTVDRKWLDRLDRADRAELNELVGYAPPKFPSTVTWRSDEHPDGMTWETLAGKVVILQSWSTRGTAGRRVVTRLERTLESLESADDVQVILLHTPEGADKAQAVLDRVPPKFPVIMDVRGTYCDELGIYKRPVNIVVGRNGAVRYVGLNPRGLSAALEALIAETPDPAQRATPRAAPDEDDRIAFPPVTGTISGALDMRNTAGPELIVDRWMTNRPRYQSPIVIVTFWSPANRISGQSIAQLASIVQSFGSSAMLIAISDESREDFTELLDDLEDESPLRFDDIPVSLAIDDRARMKNAAQIRTIPHTLVMSRDWIVRWQGPTARLKRDTIERIVRADEAQAGEPTETVKRNRWAAKQR